MSGGNWLQILGSGVILSVLAILGWILRRSERALSNSSTAIDLTNRNVKSAGEHMALMEALRQAIFLQGQGLDKWEDWGVEVKRDWRVMQRELLDNGSITEITELPTPPKHIDLTALFRELPRFGPNSATGDD
jgi:hypothetical protein